MGFNIRQPIEHTSLTIQLGMVFCTLEQGLQHLTFELEEEVPVQGPQKRINGQPCFELLGHSDVDSEAFLGEPSGQVCHRGKCLLRALLASVLPASGLCAIIQLLPHFLIFASLLNTLTHMRRLFQCHRSACEPNRVVGVDGKAPPGFGLSGLRSSHDDHPECRLQG